jgi:hypothetical protein
MAFSGSQLNRFERHLFKAAVILAGLVILVRLAAMLFLTLLRHTR